MSKSQNTKEVEALKTTTKKLLESRLKLLEENERHTANTKGKAKATEQDDEKEVEFWRKIENIDNTILDIRDSCRDIMYTVTKQPHYATFDRDTGPMSTSTSYEPGINVDEDEDEGPIWNPFTNSYAYRETGFEPGPSGLSGDSRQFRKNRKQERKVLIDASLENRNDFTEYSKQRRHRVSKHIPIKPVELNAGNKPLRGGSSPSTKRRDVAVHGLDSRDSLTSRSSNGKLAFVGNIIQSCRRWLFERKFTANDTNQGFPSRIKSSSKVDLSSSKPSVTSFRTCFPSPSLTITGTPRLSTSLASSRRSIPQTVKTKMSYRDPKSHSDSTRDCARKKVGDVPPKSASSVFPYEKNSNSSSETLRQRLSGSMFPRSRSLSLEQQEYESDQVWYGPEQLERGTQQTWSEDESFLLALALEEEDKAKTKEHELSHRLAMRLQLQEDREVAERQEWLEMEWLQEGRRLQEAVLETERRTVAETERLQRELQAQEVVFQVDAELAARLNDSNRAIQSDREVAEQLQAEIEREAAAEYSLGSLCGKSEVTTRQKKAKQGVDRSQRRSRTIPSKANASAHAWTTQPDQIQASQGLQNILTTVPATDDLDDEGECSLCTDSFPKTQLARPCEHFYCRGCLAAWFQRAVNEKPKQQPQCCKRILPVNLVSRQLGADFVKQYKLFELEIRTPNPLYCSNRKCGAFIPPENIHGDIGTCRCRERTCRYCRARRHPNSLCVEDKETQRVEAIGKKAGWKHCPSCRHLIEKTEGCLHMKCSQCQTDFCWSCLKRKCDGTCPR